MSNGLECYPNPSPNYCNHTTCNNSHCCCKKNCCCDSHHCCPDTNCCPKPPCYPEPHCCPKPKYDNPLKCNIQTDLANNNGRFVTIPSDTKATVWKTTFPVKGTIYVTYPVFGNDLPMDDLLIIIKFFDGTKKEKRIAKGLQFAFTSRNLKSLSLKNLDETHAQNVGFELCIQEENYCNC